MPVGYGITASRGFDYYCSTEGRPYWNFRPSVAYVDITTAIDPKLAFQTLLERIHTIPMIPENYELLFFVGNDDAVFYIMIDEEDAIGSIISKIIFVDSEGRLKYYCFDKETNEVVTEGGRLSYYSFGNVSAERFIEALCSEKTDQALPYASFLIAPTSNAPYQEIINSYPFVRERFESLILNSMANRIFDYEFFCSEEPPQLAYYS